MEPKNGKDIGSEPVFKKLGKSIVAGRDIKADEEFTLQNLSGKIFSETYIPVRNSNKLIGKKSTRAYKKGEAIKDEI